VTGRTPLRLVVGLGNPGSQYARTRHNAGFWFADEWAGRLGVRFRYEAKWQADVATTEMAGQTVHLVKPMAFMNRSGQPVGSLARFLKLVADQILVVHDELDFEPGVVRLKIGGGHGGHNGLRDIIAVLGGPGFLRLRFGIGRPSDPRPTADYVLSRPDTGDERLIHEAIQRVLDDMELLCEGALDPVMTRLHSA
jgi:PTH1 family peptidyl-tRNA hydrolase